MSRARMRQIEREKRRAGRPTSTGSVPLKRSMPPRPTPPRSPARASAEAAPSAARRQPPTAPRVTSAPAEERRAARGTGGSPRDEDRTLVIKRRTPTEEPLPNAVDTASTLREISERPVKVSRKERRARRKQAEAEAKRAHALAKAEAKRDAKEARRRNKDGEAPTEVDTEASTQSSIPRRSWRERKGEKLLDAIGAVEGEELVLMADGRARLRSATLIITTYRVAVISRGARKRVLGWIPLEEIERVKRVWRGAETLHIEGSFERLSFQASAARALREVTTTLKAEVREARRGPNRHHPDVIQLWCERTNEIWESEANRFRLWIRKHPIFTVAWLGSMIPVAYLGAQHLL